MVGVSLGFFLPATVRDIREIWTIKHATSGIPAVNAATLKAIYPKLTVNLIWQSGLLLPGLWLLWRFWMRKAKPAGNIAAALESKSAAVAPKTVRRPAKQSWQVCNVLDTSAGGRQVWQFDARNNLFVFGRQHSSAPGEPLPAKLVAKTWSSLWQKKLNVAWLPPENVFLRVAHFPRSSPEETHAMVELQLEKLSPIPVTQTAWSMHILPHATGDLQTVVVIFVARNVVEEFLGRLEGDGYVADRLELPLLDQLQASAIRSDGAWIYPETQGGRNTALVAWWYGGVLQNVDLLALPAPASRAAGLKDQLMQMAWAGELEGWLTAPPHWHLVGDDATAAEWVTPLQEGLEQRVEVIPPLPGQDLAARTAQRAAQTDPAINLLPAEFAVRYRQQFVDRLWMRGLFSALALYGIGLLIYFVALGFLNYQTKTAEKKVADLGGAHTNAMQIKAQYLILKERQELKYAALECWEAVAETLPENMTLDSINFGESRNPNGGRTLQLSGTAPAGEVNTVFDFGDKLRRAPEKTSGQPLFNPNFDPPRPILAPGGTVRWTCELELKRAER